MWSNLALVVALLYVPSAVVDAQLFTGSSCSICPTTLPEVGLPDVVLEAGFAGVLLEDQTCGETEELAQAGAFSRASCVLLRTSGVSNICGCQEADAPIPVPVAVPTRRPVAAPVPVPVPVAEPTDAPEPAPTDAPVVAPTDVPVVAPTEAPVVAPTEAPVVVVAPTDAPDVAPTASPVVVVAPTETPVAVPTPTASPVAVVSPTTAPVTLFPSMVNVTSNPPSMTGPSGTVVPVPTMATAPPGPFTPAEAEVVIRLMSTSGPLTESATSTFLAVCAEFYNEYLPGAAMNVTCEIPGRRLKEVQRSFHLRALQGQALAPLDITTNVMAMFDETAGVIAFANELIETTNTNSGVFATQLRTRGDGVSQVYFQSVMEVAAFDPMSVPPVAAPVPATTSPVAAAPVAPPSSEEEDDNRLSTGAIVGIIVGVIGGLAIFGGGAYLASQSNPNPEVRAVHTDPVGEDFPSPHAKSSAPVVTKSYDKEPAPVPPAATAAVATAAAAAAASEGNKDGMSVMTGSEMDAYSLDAGNVDQPSSAPGTKRDTVDGMSQSGDEMSSHAMSSLRQNMVSRTVVAPPGKLGIVIDTTLEGPVVHKINPQSPLEGTLFPGDIIVAIDDVDTRAMSASAITALMVRTANLRRKLTVLSEDVTN